MAEYDSHINITLGPEAKDNKSYRIREVEIEHTKIKVETPYKIIDGKNINKNAAVIANNIKKPIFESSAYICRTDSWKKLHYLLEDAEQDKVSGLNNLIGIRNNLWSDSQNTVSFVFAKNPFVENAFIGKKKTTKIAPISMDGYEGLLDHIHSASKALVLTPDIRIKNADSIELKEYIKFVDHSVKILSDWNTRPIFAPIQIHLNQKRSTKILEHYKEQGYKNIWVNFNASHIGGTYVGRLRSLIRRIDKIMGLENTTLYYSHIKKEITPNINDEKTFGSDILSQFFAADFIGVNREPFRAVPEDPERIKKLIQNGKFRNETEYERAKLFNRSRMFDPASYYYYRIDRYPGTLPVDNETLVNKMHINKLANSVLLHAEIEKTKKYVEQNKKINPYIKNKKAIEENQDVLEILEEENRAASQKKFSDFLGGL